MTSDDAAPRHLTDREQIARALVDIAHDFGHGESVVVRTSAAADAVLSILGPRLTRLPDELKRLRAAYELSVQRHTEQTAQLQAEINRYCDAHRSTQRALVSMEIQRDELRHAIVRAAGYEPDLTSGIDTDYLALLADIAGTAPAGRSEPGRRGNTLADGTADPCPGFLPPGAAQGAMTD